MNNHNPLRNVSYFLMALLFVLFGAGFAERGLATSLELHAYSSRTLGQVNFEDSKLGQKIAIGFRSGEHGYGRLVADSNGRPLVTSLSREIGSLTSLDTGTIQLESNLLKGVNRKGMVATQNGWLIAVDYWPESGNTERGLFTITRDGAATKVNLPLEFNGLSDLINNSGSGWLFSDFEADNIFALNALTADPTPLIAENIPAGLYALALNPKDKSLFALERQGAGPLAAVSRFLLIDEKKTVVLHEGRQLEGLAFNNGNLFPPGLYFSDRLAGAIFRMQPDRSIQTVLTGLTNPSDLLFDPRDGSLLVICEDSLILRFGPKAHTLPAAFQAFQPDTIELAGKDLDQVVIDVDTITTLTSADGTARMIGLPAGVHQLRIDHPGYQLLEQSVTIKAAGVTKIKLPLKPVASQTINGTVRAENSISLAGAHILFSPVQTTIGRNGPRRIMSNLAGAYTAQELPEGNYNVRAGATGFIDHEVQLEVPSTAPVLDFQLKPVIDSEKTVQLHIQDIITGKPLAKAKVNLAEAGPAGLISEAITDTQGRARFAKLALGRANLAANNTLALSHDNLTATITAEGYRTVVVPFAISDKELTIGLAPLVPLAEKEPNNDLASAQSVPPNSTVSLKIAEMGDRDLFKFTLAHQTSLTIETGENPPIQTMLRLLDEKGTELRNNGAYANQQNRISALGLLPGTYLVQVEEWNNDAVSDQEVQLRILAEYAADPLEPNDNPKQARLTGVNQEIRGTLLPLKDQDWFRFHLERSGRLQIFMEPVNTQRHALLYREGEEKELASQGVYGGQPLDLQQELSPGNYLVCVREWGDDSESLEPYTLRLNYLEDDQIDDPPADVLPLTALRTLEVNGFASGTILPMRDLDRYAIALPSAGRLDIQGLYPGQLHLQLKAQDGTLLTERGTYASQINGIRYETVGPTTVYLDVMEWGNDAASNELYTLTTNWLPADPIDSRLRNDDFATSTIIHSGDRLRNTILPLKDLDYYRLELDHPGYIRARGKSPIQLQVRWYSKDHKELAQQGYYANQDIDLATPVLAGTYYLEVREWGDDDASGLPYELEIVHDRAEPGEKLLTDADPARTLLPGIAQTFIFDHNSDIDLFNYQMQQPGPVVFTIKNPLQTLVRVIDTADDAVLFEQGYYANSKIVVPLEIAKATSLKVVLTEWGNDAHGPEPGILIADREEKQPPQAAIAGIPCGDSAGTACFTVTPVAETVPITSAEIDVDLDGRFDLVVDLKNGAEYRFPKPGIQQVDVRMTADSGVSTVQRIWVDTRQQGESLEVELAIEGVEDGDIVEEEKSVTIFAAPSSGARISRVDCLLDGKTLATMHTPPFQVELPWLTMPTGVHTLEVETLDSRGKKKQQKITFELSEYFGLAPADKAEMTGENVRISWSGNRFGDAVVQYRQVGAPQWLKVTGESGRQRSVLLTKLSPGNQYEYQVLSGKKPSQVKTFKLLKGLAFGTSTYGVNINRDYDQRFGISVRNNGAAPLTVRLECGKPEDPLLLVGFVGSGSEDKPFALAPGEEREFMLGLSAQDVVTASHSFPVRIVSETGLSDEAMVNVSVRLPKIKLVWQDMGPAVYGLGQKLRIVNQGDTITDLAVFSENPDIYIVPTINHGLLHAGGQVDVTAYPRLSQGFKGISAKVQARGLNKLFAHDLNVKLKEGEQLFPTYLIPGIDPLKEPQEYNRCLTNAQNAGNLDPDTVDWTKAEFPEDQDLDGNTDRWYVMDSANDVLWVGDDTDADTKIDFVHGDKGMDGIFEYSAYRVNDAWQRTNLVEAWLEMGFTLPWDKTSYKEHDVDIVLNGQVVGMLRDTIPNGNYTFRLPPQLIRFNEAGMPESNIIGINTKHLRGGHYVVNSDFRFNFRLTATPVWSVGASRKEAYQKALAIEGMSIEAPDYSISSSDMQLSGPEILETGQERQVQAMIRNLGALSSPQVTVALFDKRPRRERQEISRITLADIPVSGKTPIALPWRTGGGEHQLIIVIDPDRELQDSDRTNNEAVLFVSVPGDDTPPELVITTPANDHTTDKPVITLTTKASDDGEIATVEASIDGGLWQSLEHRAAEQYTAKLLLQPGTHQILVRANDLSGNASEQKISVSVAADKPVVDIVFPEKNSKIQSRTSNVVIKVPAEAVAAAARVDGSPWYRAKVAGGFGKVTVPLRFGNQEIEAMVIRQDGVVNSRKITVECTRQPKANEAEDKSVQNTASGQVSVYELGEVDLFNQLNAVVAEPGS